MSKIRIMLLSVLVLTLSSLSCLAATVQISATGVAVAPSGSNPAQSVILGERAASVIANRNLLMQANGFTIKYVTTYSNLTPTTKLNVITKGKLTNPIVLSKGRTADGNYFVRLAVNVPAAPVTVSERVARIWAEFEADNNAFVNNNINEHTIDCSGLNYVASDKPQIIDQSGRSVYASDGVTSSNALPVYNIKALAVSADGKSIIISNAAASAIRAADKSSSGQSGTIKIETR